MEPWPDPLCLLQQLFVVVQDQNVQCLHEAVAVRSVTVRVCAGAAEQVDWLVVAPEQVLRAQTVEHLVQQWECSCERVRPLVPVWRH